MLSLLGSERDQRKNISTSLDASKHNGTRAELRLWSDLDELAEPSVQSFLHLSHIRVSFPFGRQNPLTLSCSMIAHEGQFQGNIFLFRIDMTAMYPFEAPIIYLKDGPLTFQKALQDIRQKHSQLCSVKVSSLAQQKLVLSLQRWTPTLSLVDILNYLVDLLNHLIIPLADEMQSDHTPTTSEISLCAIFPLLRDKSSQSSTPKRKKGRKTEETLCKRLKTCIL